MSHAQAARPDGSRGGCLWSWHVKPSALARLGISPPPDPEVQLGRRGAAVGPTAVGPAFRGHGTDVDRSAARRSGATLTIAAINLWLRALRNTAYRPTGAAPDPGWHGRAVEFPCPALAGLALHVVVSRTSCAVTCVRAGHAL